MHAVELANAPTLGVPVETAKVGDYFLVLEAKDKTLIGNIFLRCYKTTGFKLVCLNAPNRTWTGVYPSWRIRILLPDEVVTITIGGAQCER